MAKYQLGDIVEASIPDPNGVNEKPRPVIILTPSAEIREDGVLVVAAISGSLIPDDLPEGWFELPFSLTGKCGTGLRKRSVAKCTWTKEIEYADVRSKRGRVPGPIMEEIARYFASLD